MFKFPALESLSFANASSAMSGAPIHAPFSAAPVYLNTTPAVVTQSRNNTMLIMAGAAVVVVLLLKKGKL